MLQGVLEIGERFEDLVHCSAAVATLTSTLSLH
jgi:hypothetical protein